VSPNKSLKSDSSNRRSFAVYRRLGTLRASRSNLPLSSALAAKDMYNNLTSIEYIQSQFPELDEDLHDEIVEGLLHLQIGVFSHFAQTAINENDKAKWAKVIATFLELWKDCSPEVKNAMNVSFLEHLNFFDGKKNRAWAYSIMPSIMRSAFDEMAKHNREIHVR
jgi:Zn-dependent M16 (insulinase) family peptidase